MAVLIAAALNIDVLLRTTVLRGIGQYAQKRRDKYNT